MTEIIGLECRDNDTHYVTLENKDKRRIDVEISENQCLIFQLMWDLDDFTGEQIERGETD